VTGDVRATKVHKRGERRKIISNWSEEREVGALITFKKFIKSGY
jgi:hypothetical protein